MSGVRQHRLRELALQKLSQAYRIDEIATSVLVMQMGVGEGVASKVLMKANLSPTSHLAALHVHFFHELIPSRSLSSHTLTDPIDRIVQVFPEIPEYWRTRGLINMCKEVKK